MKIPFILFVGILPFQPLLAQSPNYFGSGSMPSTPSTPSMPSTPSTPDLPPAAPVPPELAAARVRYDLEVKQATAPIRARYAQTLEVLKRTLGGKGDLAAALAVQQEIERVGAVQSSLFSTTKEAKVVIWNQHNAGHNNCGTKTLNVILLNDGREVWRQNDVKIPWEKDEDRKVEISVPAVPTDKLRVELTDAQEGNGGLAEIEYWRNGRNYARKRPVAVSSVWNNSAKCGAATLTDGITTSRDESVGYWSMAKSMPGWAEVSLNLAD